MSESIRVLYVDDNDEYATLTAQALEQERDGLEVTVETCVSDALETLRSDSIDCIVSDYDMPDRDGLDFLADVREHDDDIPFILYTAKGSEELASEAISTGVTDYFKKSSESELYPLLANRIAHAVDQSRTARDLHHTHERYSRLLQHSTDFIFTVNDEGEVQYVTPSVEGIMGYTPDELVGTNAFDLVHPDDTDSAMAAFEEVLAAPGTSATVTFRAKQKDDSWLWLEVRGSNRLDDPYIEGVIINGREVTERKNREQELEQFQAFVDNTTDLITLLDEDGVITYQSPSVEDLLGYEPDDLIGDRAIENVHPDDRDLVLEGFDRAIESSDETVSIEYRYQHANDTWRWLESRTNDQLDNPAIEGIIVNSRDITERIDRKAELERYETIVEVTGDPVYTIDSEGKFTYVNEALESLTGISESQLLGEHVSICMDESGVNRGEELIRELITSDRDRGTFEMDLLTADGRRIPTENHIAVLLDNGTLRGSTGIIRDISERKERERRLHREHERRAALFDNASDPIVRIEFTDGEPVIRDANGAFADVFGYSIDEITDRPVDEVLVPESEEPEHDQIKRRVLEGESIEDEVRRLTADGPRDFLLRVVPFTVDDDRRGSYAIYIDITERKTHEERLEVLHEATRDLMAAQTRDEVAEITAVAAREALEYPNTVVRLVDEERTELVPENVTDAAREQLGERPTYSVEESPVGRAYQSGDPVVVDDIRELDDGYDRGSVRSAMYLPIGKHGTISIGDTQVGQFDDSDVRLGSILVSNAEAAFDRVAHERERERYRTMANAAADMVYTLDENGRFQFVNDAAETLTGYDRSALVGEHVSLVMEEADIERGRQLIRSLLEETGLLSDSFEWELQRADETTIPVESHITLLLDGDDFDGSVGVVRDITDRRERERELERQNERLEEFAQVVSHDLKNPLNVASGNLELARQDCESDYLDKVAKSHDRIERMVQDTLTLAREGQAVDDPEPVNLDQVSKACWLNVQTENADIEVEDGLVILADHSRLQHVFENLFGNAIKHGGEDVTVRVGALRDGFFVEDDGPGIPLDDRDALFDVGFSTSEDGSGIGLAIVKRIVEAHGWSINVTESESGGARFEITDATVC